MKNNFMKKSYVKAKKDLLNVATGKAFFLVESLIKYFLESQQTVCIVSVA